MKKQTTLVLTSLENSSNKAVINFEINDESFEGRIRLYNFKQKPEGILTLGVLCDGKVVKTALKEKDDNLYTFNSNNKIEKEAFTCAIINVKNGDVKPILLGATNGQNVKTLENRLAENLYLLDDENITPRKVEIALNESEIDYEKEEKREIERHISCELGGNERCATCKYREAFFNGSQTTSIESLNNESTKKEVLENEENFYDEIKEQLSVLFDKYPEETFLKEVIPNSKWVKVDYETDGAYYVIGLIYENEKIKFVCYGVPGEFSERPNNELVSEGQWLPLDPEKPEDLGYWISYQDAETGENVEVNVS